MNNNIIFGTGLAKVEGQDGTMYLISFKDESDQSIVDRAAEFYGKPMKHVINVRFHRVPKMDDATAIGMFGSPLNEMRDGYAMTEWTDPQSLQMTAMSIISDVQELIARGSNEFEHIRMGLNQAKYMIAEAKRIASENEQIYRVAR